MARYVEFNKYGAGEMKKLTLKEKIAFNFIFNEKRVYHRCLSPVVWSLVFILPGLRQVEKGDTASQQLVSMVSGMG
jgi:hypothetical protein